MLSYLNHIPPLLLAKMNQAWSEQGAQVSLWADGKPIWPSSAAEVALRDEPMLTAPVVVAGTAVAQLALYGGNPADQPRLEADAHLLGHLASLEFEMESLTSDLVETQDQLLALYDLTRASRSHLSVPDTVESVVTEIARLVTAEATFAVLEAPPEWPDLVACHQDCLLNKGEMISLFQQVRETGAELLWQGADAAALLGKPVRNLLLVPVQIQGEIRAGLGFLNKQTGPFLSPDLKLIRAIAEQVGAQIENALLLHETVQQARLQTEIRLAQEVQLQLLPRHLPQVADLDLFACSRPARQVGGDFYDFIHVPGRPLLFNVGDVSGKGVSSALLMTMVRTIIRSAGRFMDNPSPQALLERANRDLYEDFSEVMMFATVFVGQYDPMTRQLVYANAGHSPVIFCPAGDAPRLLEADGAPVGVLPQSLATNQRLSLAKGDVLVIASDGFNEAHNAHGEMFGLERLLALTGELRAKTAVEIAKALYEAVVEFAAGQEQADDQTLIVAKGVA